LRQIIPFKGEYALQVVGAAEVTGTAANLMEVPYPGGKIPGAPVTCRLRARSAAGIARETETVLTFAQAPRLGKAWDAVPVIEVAEDCAPLIKSQFGANRPYPGRETYSGQVQFAWTTSEFRVRVRVLDAVHFQPMNGHFMYYGDSLQLI